MVVHRYNMCEIWILYMVTLQRLPIFHYFVYKSMGASSTGSTPTTLCILMRNFIIS